MNLTARLRLLVALATLKAAALVLAVIEKLLDTPPERGVWVPEARPTEDEGWDQFR